MILLVMVKVRSLNGLFFYLEKADRLMMEHKKLKKENTELQQQNEKLT